MFGFNIRSPERDRETDLARFKRVATTLAAVKSELKMEKAGLGKRFAEASADAALTLEAMNENIDPDSYETRLESLTMVIKSYEKRIIFLDAQLEFVDGVIDKISSFYNAQ